MFKEFIVDVIGQSFLFRVDFEIELLYFFEVVVEFEGWEVLISFVLHFLSGFSLVVPSPYEVHFLRKGLHCLLVTIFLQKTDLFVVF